MLPWVRKICWKRDRLLTPIFLGFPCGSDSKESACKEGDLGSASGFGRSPVEGKGYPLQESGLENSMDCICIPHGVTESDRTERLSLSLTFEEFQEPVATSWLELAWNNLMLETCRTSVTHHLFPSKNNTVTN